MAHIVKFTFHLPSVFTTKEINTQILLNYILELVLSQEENHVVFNFQIDEYLFRQD